MSDRCFELHFICFLVFIFTIVSLQIEMLLYMHLVLAHVELMQLMPMNSNMFTITMANNSLRYEKLFLLYEIGNMFHYRF